MPCALSSMRMFSGTMPTASAAGPARFASSACGPCPSRPRACPRSQPGRRPDRRTASGPPDRPCSPPAWRTCPGCRRAEARSGIPSRSPPPPALPRPHPLRPFAARRVRDGEQRPPVVSRAAVDAGWHFRVGRGDRIGVVGAQRAAFRASTSRWPTRSMRKDSVTSLDSFRLRSTGIERSARVSGRVPMSPMATAE